MTTQVARQGARASRPAVSADAPILAAKITAPGVPGWAVPRPRITELIVRGRRWCPLTVITAPAGAGKTMALALWAAAEPGPVAWVGRGAGERVHPASLPRQQPRPVRSCWSA